MRSESMSSSPSLEILELVVHGAPTTQTLHAIAGMAARLPGSARCALLLERENQLVVEAEYNLHEEDWLYLSCLTQSSPLTTTTFLSELAQQNGIYAKPLLTPAMEFIGALVAFGIEDSHDLAVVRGLEEMRCMATLALEQRHLSEELAYRAHHDPLTHLKNRIWVEEEMGRVLADALGRQNYVGLAILGLDRFRVINDVLGYQTGNGLLRQVAQRLAEWTDLRASLARGSGDEFMILMPDLALPELAESRAQSLLDCFEKVFQVGSHELVIKASIGVATSAEQIGQSNEAELLNQAFTALRYAKTCARGKVAVFNPSMVRVPPERLVMEQHLRFALTKGEFQLYYQPQIDLSSGNLVGVEALLRWRHPSLGLISPAIFIPLAEEIGLIEDLGDWILDEAINQLQAWCKAGLPNIRMAVNVSALQFAQPSFGALVADKLRQAGIRPEQLELEITESTIMSNFEHGLQQMKFLRNLGVLIAIDDFGTGHSSLAYLQQLPIHRLKVDRMFVRDIVGSEDAPPLLASIVQMARALNLRVIAEGVETTEQLQAISAMNCEEVQGYFFSKALPSEELLHWVRTRHSKRPTESPNSVSPRQIA